jgi:hypothetical protein
MKTRTLAGRVVIGLALLQAGAPFLHAQPVQIATGTTRSIQFMNGGIDRAERASMRQAGKAFKLRVEFSEGPDDASIADSALTITDVEGRPVLVLAHAGPIVNVNLPNGAYRVAAGFQGRTEIRSVSLRGRDGADLYFHWNAVRKAVALQGSRTDGSFE